MMDRRLFLGLGGGVLAAGATLGRSGLGTHGGARPGAEPAAPFALGSQPLAPSPLLDAAALFRERLALLGAGRLELAAGARTDGAKAIEIGFEDEIAARRPGLALLDAIATDSGPADAFSIWLRGLGGQHWWDAIGQADGMKPLHLATFGKRGWIWSRQHPSELPERQMQPHAPSLRHAVAGMAGRILSDWGVTAVEVESQDAAGLIGRDSVDLLEIPDSAAAIALFQASGGVGWWHEGSFNASGRVLAVRIPLAIWTSLSEGDRALFEAAALHVSETTAAIERAHANQLHRVMRALAGETTRYRAATALPDLPIAQRIASEAARRLLDEARADPRLFGAIAALGEIDHPLARALVGSTASNPAVA